MLKVYFETQSQSLLFLVFCAAGFACAALFELTRLVNVMKPALDIGMALLLGALLFFLMFEMRLSQLRAFYLLALACGAMIYRFGVRALAKCAVSGVRGLLIRLRSKKDADVK